MEHLRPVLLALLAGYSSAIAFGLFLEQQGQRTGWVAAGLASMALACPLLIPPERIGLRAIVAFIAVDLFFKVVDAGRRAARGAMDRASYSDYCRFLVPFPFLLVVWSHRKPWSAMRRPQGAELVPLAGLLAVLGGVACALAGLSRSTLFQSSFLLDHIVKVGLFVLTLETLSRCLQRIEGLLGFDAPPFVDGAALSLSPGEFWRRYNTRVHAWFEVNVFRLRCLRRSPATSVCAVFLASGLLHELMFGIATSRFDGYQLTFFVLQAPAVLASGSLERFAASHGAPGRLAARALTILWFLSTSVFFFHGVDRVIPIVYASTPWLP